MLFLQDFISSKIKPETKKNQKRAKMEGNVFKTQSKNLEKIGRGWDFNLASFRPFFLLFEVRCNPKERGCETVTSCRYRHLVLKNIYFFKNQLNIF